MRQGLLKVLLFMVKFLYRSRPELHRTAQLVKEWEAVKLDRAGKEVSGERKRNQVLNRLASEFPETPKKSLSLFIELVVQE